jgi:PAS domain S-box-containing protein
VIKKMQVIQTVSAKYTTLKMMGDRIKILFVEDNLADAEKIWRQLKKDNIIFHKNLIETKDKYLEAIEAFRPDIIVSEYVLHQFDAMTALRIRNEQAPLTPFILVTEPVNEEAAMACLRAGADDYILKDRLSRLGLALKISLEKINLQKQKNAAEISLKESEERYRVFFNDAIVGLYRSNKHGRIIQANKALIKMLGFRNLEELTKKHPNDIIHGFSNRRHEFTAQIEKQGEVKNLEAIWNRQDGKLLYVNESAKAVHDTDGTILFFYGSVENITEKRRAEEARKESQHIIDSIINNLPARVFWKDLNLVYLGCNKVFASDAGFEDEDDIIGKTDYQLVWKEQAEAYRTDDIQVIQSGNAKLNIEEIQHTPQGGTITLLTNKVPLRNSKGTIYGLLGTYVDISERKKAEKELLSSNMFNETLLKTIPFGMHIVDQEGTIIFQNENVKRIFREGSLGKKCWDLFRHNHTKCSSCPLIKEISIGKTETYECHNVGEGRIFEINYTGMLYRGKKALLEIFQDITDKKKREIELEITKEKAEESDRLKTAFIQNISHEIRTPMNAIVGFSSLLGDPVLDPQTFKTYLESIIEGSNHLAAIIGDIMDISQIEAKLMKLNPYESDINTLIQSVCNQFLLLAKKKEIDLSYSSSLSYPDSLVRLDHTKVKQILSTLINNSLKFTEQGYVKLNCRKQGNAIKLTVSDTGLGIPPEYQGKIFDRFYQVPGSKTKLNEGTGLGLAIAKGYVEIMGGEIWLESEITKGSSFHVLIPYKTQKENPTGGDKDLLSRSA